jgi:hypothetical protein
MCNSKIECTLPKIAKILTQINTLISYLRKANYDTRFSRLVNSSATTGQLWVSLLTPYDSLLTPFFTITDRLMCTRVIAHFLTFKRLEKFHTRFVINLFTEL